MSDYTAVMASESVMAILSRKGCLDLEKIACRDYSFPDHSELEEDIAKVQAVKRSFLCGFWKVSGREIVCEAAQRRLEEVCFSFLLSFLSQHVVVLMLLIVSVFLHRQSELTRLQRMLWRVLVQRTLQEDPDLVGVKKLTLRVIIPRFRPVTTLVGDFYVMGGDLDLYSNLLLFFV